MPRLNAADNAQTTLSSGMAAGDTTANVTSTATFPSAPFRISVDNEIMEVSTVGSGTFTVLRAQEGTTAASHSSGATIQNRWTSGTYGELLSYNQAVSTAITQAVTDSPYTFARASVAYTLEGVQVASGVPRYETGLFNQGLMIEEGTTNLLTANQSHPASTAYWQCGGAGVTHTLSISSTVSWAGGTSLEDVITGYVSGDCYVSGMGVSGEWDEVPVLPNTSYTVSQHVQAPSGASWYLRVIQWNAAGGVVSDSGQLVSLTGNGAFQYAEATIVTATTTAYISLRAEPQANGNWYFDGWQVEQKAYATSWIPGASSRAAETLTIPTAGVFVKGSWTIELVYIPTSSNLNEPGNTVLFDCYIDDNNRYILYVNQVTGFLTAYLRSGGTLVTWADTVALTAGNKYRIMFGGNGSVARLCKEGAQIGSDTAYIEPAGTLPANMYIGSNFGRTAQANGLIDDLRISSRARTLAEHRAYVSSGLAIMPDASTTFYAGFDAANARSLLQNINTLTGGVRIQAGYSAVGTVIYPVPFISYVYVALGGLAAGAYINGAPGLTSFTLAGQAADWIAVGI